MLTGPFPPWPNFTPEEAAAVSDVLLSNKVNYWTGQEGRMFEREFATFAGTDHAIALANGTLALDLALYGLKIGAHNGGKSTDEETYIGRVSATLGLVPLIRADLFAIGRGWSRKRASSSSGPPAGKRGIVLTAPGIRRVNPPVPLRGLREE